MGGIKDYAILLVMKEDFVTNDMILSPYVRISRKFGFFEYNKGAAENFPRRPLTYEKALRDIFFSSQFIWSYSSCFFR